MVQDVVSNYDVCIRPLRGYSSLSFIHQAASELARIPKLIFIYYLGDHDPSGLDIERASRDRFLEMFQQLDYSTLGRERISWNRLALLPGDFEDFSLIPLPAKARDSRCKDFVAKYGPGAAELDALPPHELRRRVEATVLRHIDKREWNKLKRIEKLERETVQDVMAQMGRGSKSNEKMHNAED